ncbi:MAG: winged helix-turn-helix domain-containing protein, partial [Terriglobia bacterium]
MKSENNSTQLLRFGVFEADLNSGEVYKSGRRLKLQDQPFQVLAALLERPGELVTREELQKKLWPGDTFVDFDSGLNRAINKIREVLDDSAESPRFVETLPRRGYRFIAPVEPVPDPPAGDRAQSPSVEPPGVEPGEGKTHGWRWGVPLTVLGIAAAVALSMAAWRSRPARHLPVRIRSIVVLP